MPTILPLTFLSRGVPFSAIVEFTPGAPAGIFAPAEACHPAEDDEINFLELNSPSGENLLSLLSLPDSEYIEEAAIEAAHLALQEAITASGPDEELFLP